MHKGIFEIPHKQERLEELEAKLSDPGEIPALSPLPMTGMPRSNPSKLSAFPLKVFEAQVCFS